MNRLTVRNSEGIGVLKYPFECERCGDLQWSLPDLGNGSPIDRLAEYEEYEEIFRLKMTDAACEFLKDKEEFAKWLDRNMWIAKKCDEYARAEEQGRLLKLPCAMGDTVYRICPKCNDSHNGSCKNCAWENSCSNRGCTVYGGWKDGQYPIGECNIVPYKVSWDYIPNLFENIGKRVFLTREKAEAALKEL